MIREKAAARKESARLLMNSGKKPPPRSNESTHGGRTECRSPLGRDGLNTTRERGD
jgi:hypothetical protein